MLLAVIIVMRFVAMVMGCFYGPYIYIVLPLGGLYLAADALLLHTVRGGKFVPEIIKDCGKIGYSGLLVLFMGREGRRKIDKNIKNNRGQKNSPLRRNFDIYFDVFSAKTLNRI